nr:retrovirus-related Pol polyprotein from transposon TNT 1-94 [Tanacetum cinerariifolium]
MGGGFIYYSFFSAPGLEQLGLSPDIRDRQDVYSSADADVPSQQELDILFGPLYDEFFNAGTNPSTTIPSTSAPSAHTNMHAVENNNDQAEEREHIPDDEFTNPFAEYVALFMSCAQVKWMRTQLQDYGFHYNKIPLYCDS